MTVVLSSPRLFIRMMAFMTAISLIASLLPVVVSELLAARTGVTVSALAGTEAGAGEPVRLRATVTDDGAGKETATIVLTDSNLGGVFYNANASECTTLLTTEPASLTVSAGTANRNFCYSNITPGNYVISIQMQVDSVDVGAPATIELKVGQSDNDNNDDDGYQEDGDVLDCTDNTALNYNPAATVDDGTCEYEQDEGEGNGNGDGKEDEEDNGGNGPNEDKETVTLNPLSEVFVPRAQGHCPVGFTKWVDEEIDGTVWMVDDEYEAVVLVGGPPVVSRNRDGSRYLITSGKLEIGIELERDWHDIAFVCVR